MDDAKEELVRYFSQYRKPKRFQRPFHDRKRPTDWSKIRPIISAIDLNGRLTWNSGTHPQPLPLQVAVASRLTIARLVPNVHEGHH